MTVGAFTLTNPGLLAHQDGNIDPNTDTMVGVLVLTAHTPSLVNDNIYSDISANECADADYTASFAEGIVLTVTVTEPSAGIVMVDMSQADFGSAVTIGARYFYVLRRAGGTLVAGDLILGYMDLNDGGSVDVESISSDFKVDANANGLYRVAKAP